jgi:hypothetical protein
MQIKEIQEKAQQTCMKNFGVKCILSTEKVREQAIEAHILKWGAPPGCVEEIREKMKLSNMKNLGVEYPLQSANIHNKIKSSNLETYGNEVFLASNAGKQLMTDLHGFPNAMQCPLFLEKAMKNAHRRKDYTLPSGKIVSIQGYEGYCIDYLLSDYNVEEDEIVTEMSLVPKVMYLLESDQSIHRYFMDIYLKDKDVGFEVKSAWTYHSEPEKNKAKWLKASKVCKNGFFVVVFDEKKNLISEEFFKDGEFVYFTLIRTTKPFKSLFF